MRLFFIAVLSAISLAMQARDTLFVQQPQYPILIERHDNILMLMRIDAKETGTLNALTLDLGSAPREQINSLKLYYGGTDARQDYGKRRMMPVEYITNFTPGRTMEAIPSYSVKQDEVQPTQATVTLRSKQKLFPGYNFFWVSIEMQPTAALHTTFNIALREALGDNNPLTVENVGQPTPLRRMGIGVRHAGDDGVSAYRIPGLVTTNRGTLLGVYDVRHNSSVDLQEYVDVGLSRSTDGGRSWEPMRLPMAFGETGGLPKAQNGVGDPSILVDTKTNTVWIVAAWTHGMGNQRAWWSSQPGMDYDHTAQLMLVKSEDDGQTWSEPINITSQVKKPEWYFLLQGPGRGITMTDGTLVFPIQFIKANREPSAGIMYSKDRGKTWHINQPARDNTTEAQVVEVEKGVLMLNMRDNRGGSRAVCTTRDLGATWTEHPSSRSALIEPVCMASIISVKAKDNVLKRDILLFSNPNSTKHRNNITLKMSLDGGKTWLPEHQVLLDEGFGWGYSCLTMIDRETIGILYESSVAQMTFQRIPLKDLMK